jgi:hypothetical protein
MADNIGGDRPLRVCDLCGGVDRDPRHVLTSGNYPRPSDEIAEKVMAAAPVADRARLMADLMDTSASDRHKDCCREAGCPQDVCGPETEGAEDLRGDDLVEFLMSKVGG